MTVEEVMTQLEEFGNEGTKKILMKHGAKEPCFGVKIADLKKIQKKVKKNHKLALELYKTGNSDAMYLAGLIADETKMTPKIIQEWVDQAYWYYISEYTVPWIATDAGYGWEMGLEWITSEEENIAAAGWSSLGNWISTQDDRKLDHTKLEELLDEIGDNIHDAKNRVRYTMNGFLISVGLYVEALTEKAQKVARKIGKINVEMEGTACKVPDAEPYIQKVIDKNHLGKKRKQARY